MKSRFTLWITQNIIRFSARISLGAGHYPTDLDGLRCPTHEGNSAERLRHRQARPLDPHCG
jgi:hypothetical protein